MGVAGDVRVVRVFVSSPSDVAVERGRVQAVAAKLNRDLEGLVRFETVLWEEHFYKADRSFQPQIPELVSCDVLVSIFWTRVGTALPADFPHLPNGEPYPSGTAYELLTALEASKAKGVPDVYVFRKTADAVLPTTDLDRRRQAQVQLDALEAFWSEWFKSEQGHFKAAFQTFANPDEFERQIEQLLRQWLESHGLLGPRLKWPKEKGSPFRGLAPFETEHAAVFFGRDHAIDEARRRLAAAAEQGTPFLLIVGASGVGKSSLARAGLIPRLMTPGVVTSIDFWRLASMKPGEAETGPIAALAAALFAALPELEHSDFSSVTTLADNLRRGGASAARPIVRALARAAEAAQRERHAEEPLRPALLLLVDQLEELFARAIEDAERTAFAASLKELVATRQVWCIATLRADLYELLLRQGVLNSMKDAGASLDLSPPGPVELAEIVRAPAAAAGLVFERNAEHGTLDQRLLADAKTADSLPLLQFTLRQLYDRRTEANGETLLTHAAYEALGGLQGAIAAEAERAVAGLSRETLSTLPRLLRQLAEPARDGKTLTQREIAQADAAAGPAQAALVQALLGARILIARQDAARRPTLRLAHDAVLASWPRAQEAAQASREFYRVRSEIEDAMQHWQAHGRPRDRLIHPGVPLAEAEKLVADFGSELPAELVGFVSASHRQARARQRLLTAAAVFFFVLAVVAIAAGIWAYVEQQRALRNFRLAQATADSLVVDIARGLANVEGLRTESVRKILETAKATFEQLSASAPDDAALQGSRAAMLDQFGETYQKLGDLADALASYREGFVIRERLARAAPGNRVRKHSLAVSDQNIGDVLAAQGNLADALTSYRDGFAVIEALAKADPDNPDWLSGLASFDERIGDALRTEGNFSDALASYRNGLVVREKLANTYSGSDAAQRDLTVLYDRVGDVLVAQGNLPDALVSYRNGLAIRERLSKADPGNTAWQRDLSVSYNKVGAVLETQGNLAEALASYRASYAIAAYLTKIDPGNTDWQSDLAACDSNIGGVLIDQNNPAEALKYYREGLAIFQRLVDTDANNAVWQRNLAVFDGEVGDVLTAQGNLPDALQSYRDAVAIFNRLIAADPSNAGWQHDLSISYEKIGDVLKVQGDLAGSLTSYQKSLVLRQRISDPANAVWQRDIAISYNRIGDVLAAQGNLADSLTSYGKAIAIVEQLLATDPSNTRWQGDLQFDADRIGVLAYKLLFARDFSNALQAAEHAVALAPAKLWLSVVRADALMFLGRTDEARALYLHNRGQKNVLNGNSWETVVLQSFTELQKAGLNSPLMGEIETLFKSPG